MTTITKRAHVAVLKRVNRKIETAIETGQDDVTDADISKALDAAAALAYPDETPTQAVQLFLKTKRGAALTHAYSDAPPAPDPPPTVTRASVHADMVRAACAMFPDKTREGAYTKYIQTKEGGRRLKAYYDMPPDEPSATPPTPTPPQTTAEKRMNLLAAELVKNKEVPTHAHGIVEVLKRDPGLYAQYLDETT